MWTLSDALLSSDVKAAAVGGEVNREATLRVLFAAEHVSRRAHATNGAQPCGAG